MRGHACRATHQPWRVACLSPNIEQVPRNLGQGTHAVGNGCGRRKGKAWRRIVANDTGVQGEVAALDSTPRYWPSVSQQQLGRVVAPAQTLRCCRVFGQPGEHAPHVELGAPIIRAAGQQGAAEEPIPPFKLAALCARHVLVQVTVVILQQWRDVPPCACRIRRHGVECNSECGVRAHVLCACVRHIAQQCAAPPRRCAT